MSNVKISLLPAETDVNNILGFAGYNAGGTCKISGADLINTLPSSTLEDVLTAGDEAIDQQILFKPTTDLRVLKLDKGGLQMSNDNVDLGIIHTGFGRIFIATVDEPIVLQSIGTGSVVFNTPEIKLQSSDVLDSTSSAGSAGEVLSSLGAGNGTEWITAGGSTPTLQQVLDTGNIAEEDAAAPTPLVGKINLVTPGGKDVTFEPNGVTNNSPNALEIDANSGILTLTSNTKVNLFGPSGGLNVDNAGNNVILYANNADDLQLNINGTGDISMYLGTSAGAPAVGDVLAAKTTGGALEWKKVDPQAFQTLAAGVNATWVINDGYNASWNVGSGSLTLAITCLDGDSGTLIVTATTGEITWPAGSLWTDGGTEPTLTNGVDVFSFIYDGTNYYWSYGQDFA